MHYYEVWVSSHRYHGDTPLTYSHAELLSNGSVVTVPLQRQTVAGVVSKKVPKPSFATKSIVRTVAERAVPGELLELLYWIRQYYPAPTGQIFSLALPTTLTKQSRPTKIKTEKKAPAAAITLPPLSKEQTKVMKKLTDAPKSSTLLHGNTGTGKTRIYIERAREVIAAGRSILVLTPEIGLTPQLALTFQESFPGQAIVMHSELTDAKRRQRWLEIASSIQPLVIVGPRSALFTPLKNVGLIVVDEFHEPAYKQEQAPHYLTSRVAGKLAELHGSQLILGSATPLVSDYYAFEQKKLPIIRMTEAAITHTFGEATIRIIDRKDKTKFTRSSWLSNELLEAIVAAQHNDQQSLVFLNRRGTARLILCSMCGWQLLCKNCDIPLTYHGDSHSVRCHTCGYHESAPTSCNSCGASDIIFRSVGTKAIVDELSRLLPALRVVRFDSDTPQKERLEQQYATTRSGSVDVLVGTQMLGKGLDLPKLAVVGIITAETSLAFPDYTSEERTYQLLTQALGRIHRGHIPGTAIIQSFDPSSQLLKEVKKNDFESFYARQIEERKLFRFPPFRHTLVLSCSRASDASARRASETFAASLRKNGLKLEVSGPMPAFAYKAHGQYRWHIIVKAVDRSLLLQVIAALPPNWSYDIDPMTLL